MKKIIAISCFALLFLSCKKDQDELKKLSNEQFTIVNFEPTFVAPLVNTETTLGEIYREVDTLVQKLETDKNLKISINSENLFVLSYAGSVETGDVNDYYQIPDTSQTISLTVPEDVRTTIAALPVGATFTNIWDTTFTFKLSPDFDALLEEVKFNNGQIAMNFSNDFNQEVTVVATITSLIDDNTGDTVKFNFATPGTRTQDISDHTANLFSSILTGDNRYNRFEANIKVSGRVINPTLTGNSVDLSIAISDLGISYVQGFLGDFNANIPSGEIAFDIFTPEEVTGFHFRDPKITFTPSSTAGIPFTMEIDTLDVGYPDGTEATLGVNGQTHNVDGVTNVSSIPNNPAISAPFIVDNTSQLDELLTTSPNKLIYAVDIVSNPMGSDRFAFFIDERSKLKVDILAELPVDFSVENYNYRDTADIDLSKLDDDIYKEDSLILDSFKKAALKIVFNNQLPIEAQVQGYLIDTAGVVIDSIFANGFEPVLANTNVNAQGIAERAQDIVTVVEVDKTKFENLTKTDKIVYVAKASTSNSSSNSFGDVKLLSTYTFGVRIGVLAEFSVDLNKELEPTNN